MAGTRVYRRSELDGQVSLLLGKSGQSLTALVEARVFLGLRLAEVESEQQRLRTFLAEVEAGLVGVGRHSEVDIAAAVVMAATRSVEDRDRPRCADRALAVIAQQPGRTGSEIAREAEIRPGHVYRVLGKLQRDGCVCREGHTYFPVDP